MDVSFKSGPPGRSFSAFLVGASHLPATTICRRDTGYLIRLGQPQDRPPRPSRSPREPMLDHETVQRWFCLPGAAKPNSFIPTSRSRSPQVWAHLYYLLAFRRRSGANRKMFQEGLRFGRTDSALMKRNPAFHAGPSRGNVGGVPRRLIFLQSRFWVPSGARHVYNDCPSRISTSAR